jgi:DNA-binding GntR family transcriptional regulator
MMATLNISNENQPLFLYNQVKNYLKNQIDSGELEPGMKLPNEIELCSMFKTSRITVRRALKELADDGLIEILHGKGTFVKAKHEYLFNINLNGFTEGMRDDEHEISKIVLEKKIITSDDEIMKLFGRTEPFKMVQLQRLIKVGSNPYSVDNSYFPCDIYPEIEDKLKDDVSTFKIIKNEYGIKFKNVIKELVVIIPSKDLADLLHVNVFETLIQVDKLIRDPNGVPVHFSRYYLPSNKVKLHFEVDIDENKAVEFR